MSPWLEITARIVDNEGKTVMATSGHDARCSERRVITAGAIDAEVALLPGRVDASLDVGSSAATTPPVETFRRKPVYAEAMQWNGTATGAQTIVDWVLANGGSARYHEERWADTSQDEMGNVVVTRRLHSVPAHIAVMVEDDIEAATDRMVVVRDAAGVFRVCTADAFAEMYEEIDPTPEPLRFHPGLSAKDVAEFVEAKRAREAKL